MEGSTTFNAINFNISLNDATQSTAQWTALMTINNTWLCPSDDNFQGASPGFRNATGPWGNYPNGNMPHNPQTGTAERPGSPMPTMPEVSATIMPLVR